jgi:hypothetical protein
MKFTLGNSHFSLSKKLPESLLYDGVGMGYDAIKIKENSSKWFHIISLLLEQYTTSPVIHRVQILLPQTTRGFRYKIQK